MDRRAVGSAAEDAAARALAARGYLIVARNVRSRGGELDIVCLDGDCFVFCEVKARRPSGFGVALEALTLTKRRRLVRLAQTYLARRGRRDAPYRIELIAVDLDAAGAPRELTVVPFA